MGRLAIACLLGMLMALSACGGSDGSVESTVAAGDCLADGTCDPDGDLDPGPGKENPAEPLEGETPADGLRIFTADPDVPDEYEGLPVGFTAAGLPFIGDEEAPVTVIEYSDYQCPFCFRHMSETTPQLLAEYGEPGDVRFVFSDFPLAGLHPGAPQGHAAAVCVAEQGAAFFWAYHDSLFYNQEQWESAPDPAAFLLQVAEGVGVETDTYEACVSSGRADDIVDQRVAIGAAAGFDATPSFQFTRADADDVFSLVGAQPLARFREFIDALVSGEDPPSDPEPAAADLPFWASPEGLAPDPDRPGFTAAGDPYRGDPDAPLTVIEFSDFQCPACRQHALETQPFIDETFVDPGAVLWVFKNFPLQMHPQAPAAAVAGECAGEQGRFFDMHHLLFETQADWSVPNPDPVLAGLGAQLGLDTAAFEACLSSRQTLERVLVDVFEGQASVRSTPTFFFLFGGGGTGVEGTRAPADFAAILEAQLEAAIEAAATVTP
jgi:protein-disulfide isomerase